MMPPELRALLGKLPYLSADVISALSQVARPVDYTDGETIINEGEHSDQLYIVDSGKVEVFHAAHEQQDEQHVVTLGHGSMLGEMALIDGEPRSLSARAEGGCRLFEVSPDDILRLPHGDRLLARLKAGLGASVVKRMRTLTDNYVGELEHKIETVREQHQFGQFFLYALAVMIMGMLLNDIIARHIVSVNVYSLTFVWEYTLLLAVPTIAIVWKMGIPLRMLGVTTVGLKRSLTEGAVISAVAVALTVALVYAGVLPGPHKGHPIIDPLPTSTYLLHSFLQELLGRGFLLSSFQRFLDDKRGIKSLVITALLFGTFHIHFGLAAVGVTAVGGIIFGALYLRHRNIAGVTLVHFILGGCAFASGLI